MLERVTDRRVVEDHDGRSGARIERGLLDGTIAVFVKTSDVANDIVGLATGDARRELRLYRSGVLDGLPDGVRSALLGIDDLGDRLVTISRDLGDAILTWDDLLDRDQVRRVFAGVSAVHRRFADACPSEMCPLATRISLFAPHRLERLRPANPGLVDAVARGHELFVDLVPAEVAAAVHRAYDDPGPLAAALAAGGRTLLHGDFFLPNVALEADSVVPLDWGMATEGPAALDLVTFCLGAMSNVAMARDELLGEARQACRAQGDDATFARCGFWALMELGWNKALDAVDHPEPLKRAVERADLDFWVEQARAALDAGLIPDHVRAP